MREDPFIPKGSEITEGQEDVEDNNQVDTGNTNNTSEFELIEM